VLIDLCLSVRLPNCLLSVLEDVCRGFGKLATATAGRLRVLRLGSVSLTKRSCRGLLRLDAAGTQVSIADIAIGCLIACCCRFILVTAVPG
jgi:hypothetical protein